MKRVLITGASGMVGHLILEQCLSSSEVVEVISLVRKPSLKTHPKLKEEVVSDFTSYQQMTHHFEAIDAAFFCIGVYTGEVPDAKFKEITVDYAVNFAKVLKRKSPNAIMCLLSGAGADRTEKSRTSFAKYKGMAENAISRLELEFYAFRPAYIYPVTPRKEPNVMYKILRVMYPLMKRISPSSSIKSTELARAMFTVALNGAEKEILENMDILKLVQ
ncbi:NAD(P)H-binding protein [Winogradskyella sp.]|uniref:NAD(P)H-binding protein n=1 Tax=Winogradskyella sp. TaxID=1883156 RepID=UPI002610353A|nr:NAD(P)H-binding protein [Winogradskyella sp.]